MTAPLKKMPTSDALRSFHKLHEAITGGAYGSDGAWKRTCKPLDEADLAKLLEHERTNGKRKHMIMRLHRRYCKLRSIRERELLFKGKPWKGAKR